jgi:hypothetical protein
MLSVISFPCLCADVGISSCGKLSLGVAAKCWTVMAGLSLALDLFLGGRATQDSINDLKKKTADCRRRISFRAAAKKILILLYNIN